MVPQADPNIPRLTSHILVTGPLLMLLSRLRVLQQAWVLPGWLYMVLVLD
jgi:hypothetical protein